MGSQHLRKVATTSNLGVYNVEKESVVHSEDTCPSRDGQPESDALDLISRNYLTTQWMEGGVMTLTDNHWTAVTTSQGGFTEPNVFISLPKLPGIVSNEGVQAVPRVRYVSILTVDGEPGHGTFETKLYQANSSLCSKEWRIPTEIGPVTVTWMVANTGAYNVSGHTFFVNQGPITRQDEDSSNGNNYVRIYHPTGCDSSSEYCAFPDGTVTAAIAQIQTLVYDRHLFVRAFNSKLRFARFVLQPHDSNDASYYVMLTPETLSMMSFEVNRTLSCLEDWGVETHIFEDVTNAAMLVTHKYTYREIPGTFGIVGTVRGLVDSTTVRVFEESKTQVNFMLQEDQCTDLETDHTTPEDVFMLTMGRLDEVSSTSCTICQVYFTPYIPTEQPTVAPSAAPSTFSVAPTADAGRLQFIEDAEDSIYAFLGNNSGAYSLSYEESAWGSLQSIGGSADWSSFVYSVQQHEGLYTINQIHIYSSGGNCANCIENGEYEIDVMCANSVNATVLLNALTDRIPISLTCNGHEWKADLCSADNSMRMCVDCASPCGCSSVTDNPLLFPSDSSCWPDSGGAAQSILIDYTPAIVVPEFVSVSPLIDTYQTAARRVSLRIIDLSGVGFIYCAGYPSSMVSSVSSFSEIPYWTQKKFFNVSTQNITIDVENVDVGVDYTAVCYTESLVSRDFSTTFTDAIAKARSFSIDNLKTITLQFDGHRLPSSTIMQPFRVQLNALPSSSVRIHPLVYHTSTHATDGTCSSDVGIYSLQSGVAFPDSLEFIFSSSASTSQNFYLDSTLAVGCVLVTLTTSGTNVDEFDSAFSIDSPVSFSNFIVVNLYGTSGPLLPPSLMSATFSSSGNSLHVKFDSDTDRGITSGLVEAGSFACDALFSFAGDSASTCHFISDLEVEVKFPVSTSASSMTLVSSGESFGLKSNSIQAACVGDLDCDAYSYSSATSVSVSLPDASITPKTPTLLNPIVSLVAPTEATTCDNIVLTYGGSQGSGGREWAGIEWIVESESGERRSAVMSELNANTIATASHQILNNTLLNEGIHVIILKLTNFLGYVGHGSVVIRVYGNTNVSPAVMIHGLADLQVLQPLNAIYLRGDVRPSSCEIDLLTSGNTLRYQYDWKVYENGVLSTAVANVASQPTDFYVSKYSLSSSASYTFELTVWDLLSGGLSTTSVVVAVEPGGVTASISNGDEIVTARQQAITLDASLSFDHNDESALLSYLWSCVEFSPSTGSCNHVMTTSTNSVLTLLSNSLALGGTYIFTVVVSNSAGSADSAEIKVVVSDTTSVSSANFASSSLQLSENDNNPLDRIVNAHEEIVLDVLLSVNGNTDLEWSQRQHGNKEETSLMLLDYTLSDAMASLSVPRRLQAGSLSPGSSYTLEIRSTPYDCSGTCATSYSQVTLMVNVAPSVGDFDVTPAVGIAGYDGDIFSMFVSNCVDDDLPLSYQYSYTDVYDTAVLLTDVSTSSNLQTVLPLGNSMISSNSYPLQLTVSVIDSLGGLAETTDTITTQSPFAVITDTALLTEALERTVRGGVNIELAENDYSNLATQVAISSGLIDNALYHSTVTPTVNSSIVLTVAADLTLELLENITNSIDQFDFFLTSDSSLFQAAIQICRSFADGTVIQSLDRSDVINAGNIYAAKLDMIFSQSSRKTMALGTGILQCYDSILSAVENLPPSNGRRLQTVDSTSTVNATLELLSSFKDMMLLGESSDDTLSSVSYYVEKGWPFNIAGIFPSEPEKFNSYSVGSGDFQTALGLFDMALATEYSVDLLSIDGLVAADCQYDLEPCDLIGSFDSSKHVLTVLTSESLSLSSNSRLISTVQQASDVRSSLTPSDAASPYELSCPIITNTQTVTVFYTCDESETLGPPEDMKLVCSSSIQGDWEGDCPLYATDVLCGDMQGRESGGSGPHCYANYTSATHSTCVCEVSPTVATAAGGLQEYIFDISMSLILGRNKIESELTAVPEEKSTSGGSTSEEDLWYVVLFVGIALLGVCLIFLIVWCIFRCLSSDDDDEDKAHETHVHVEEIHTYEEDATIPKLEMVHKQKREVKDNEVKTTAQIKFDHNMAHANDSFNEQNFRLAKSYYKNAIEVVKEDKATGNPSIETKDVALCYFEYAEVLEKLGDSRESVAMYKKAYVLDQGLEKSGPKPRTLGELKRQLSAHLEENEESTVGEDCLSAVEIPPPRNMDGHIWQPQLCEGTCFCQICKAYIGGDTLEEQNVYQCNVCEMLGHRDCIVSDRPPCIRSSSFSAMASGFFGSLSNRARGIFGGRKAKKGESGYNTMVAGRKELTRDSSYNSQDMDHQPDMTNLYEDDTNDINFLTMEQKVDWAGRKSVAIQSTKISNPAQKKPKSILKKSWADSDAYQSHDTSESPPETPPRTESPPPAKSQREQLLRQESDSSAYDMDDTYNNTIYNSQNSTGRSAVQRKNSRGKDGLTTYEMIDHQTEDFNI